jgi:regulator of RNase E activity RraA
MNMDANDVQSRSQWRAISTSTWADALDAHGITGVIGDLVQRSGQDRTVGRALTVRESYSREGTLPLEAFAVADIIGAISPGAVIVIAAQGVAVSTFGSLAARSAMMAGASGVVIDGACRDVTELRQLDLWVASRHVTPLTGKRRLKVDAIGETVEISGVTVCSRDLIIADASGVVVIPGDSVDAVYATALRLHALDRQIDREIATGASFKAARSNAGYL